MSYFNGKEFQGFGSEPPVDEDAAKRLRQLTRFFAGWAIVILVRLMYLQLIAHDDYAAMASSQQQKLVELPAPRGAILDRELHPLAMSVPVRSVVVNPLLLPNAELASEVLSRVLDLDRKELLDRIRTAQQNDRGFLWVKRKISVLEAERVKALKLTGVEFRDETTRKYPKDSLAAHVVGCVDHEDRGACGIELGLQDELEGIPGSLRIMTDVTRRGYDSRIETAPQAGKTIVLTLDERIQHVAERELKKAIDECRCKSGSIVVMDPRTGDILAMASYPTFNPNEPLKRTEDQAARLNLAVAAPFEPGSVFKLITLAAALETTRLGPDSPINCGNGTMSLFGRVIHEAKRGFGVMPMRMVLAKSSNIGAIQIGMQVGVKNLYDYIVAFGFGQRVGLPLPAESPGQVFEPRKWGKTSIGSVAMGHEVMTTSLQLAQACSVVANNGVLVKPRIVISRQRPGDPIEVEPASERTRVLRPESAVKLREMMLDVVLQGGTGTAARIAGYSVGGKTGSAQIYDHTLKQYTHKYNASFVGMAPLSEPKVVAVVTLNGSAQYGGAVAAPVFKEVVSSALRILDVRKDEAEDIQFAKEEKPDENEQVNDLAIAGLTEGMPELIATANIQEGLRVPNLVGKTRNAVLNEIASTGLPVDLRGSGIARAQKPAAGSVLQPGEQVTVQFTR